MFQAIEGSFIAYKGNLIQADHYNTTDIRLLLRRCEIIKNTTDSQFRLVLHLNETGKTLVLISSTAHVGMVLTCTVSICCAADRR